MQGLIGSRVVRGPDWKWKNQDGGDGHCGTVRAFEGTRDVVVIWDNGTSANYRCAGAFDLRVWDSSPAGQGHEGTTCDGCSLSPICGQRFKCSVCDNVDLCSWCYHGDKHNPKHRFTRETTPGGEITEPLEKRSKSKKIQLRGFFPGAKVVRGTDWEWENQDGGAGRVGKLLEVQDWSPSRPRSAVQVQWASSTKNLYRLGFQGMVDIKVIAEGKGPMVYREHLPVLGQRADTLPPDLTQGDLVRLSIDEERAQQLQDNPSMAGIEQVVNVVGTFQTMTDGKAVVNFPGGVRWTVNPSLLVKVARERRATAPSTSILTQLTQTQESTAGAPPAAVVPPISSDVPRRRAATRSTGSTPATPGRPGSGSQTPQPAGSAPLVRQASGQSILPPPPSASRSGYETVAPAQRPLPTQTSAPDVRRSPARARDRGTPAPSVGNLISFSTTPSTTTAPATGASQPQSPPPPYAPPSQTTPLQPVPAAAPALGTSALPSTPASSEPVQAPVTQASLNVGDVVQIAAQEDHVRQLQRGHGEWADTMKQILGKIGRVIQVYPNGDLQVEVAGSPWTLNPLCVTRLALNELSNQPGQDDQVSEILQKVFEVQEQAGHSSLERLIKAAVIGDLPTIKEICESTSTPVSVEEAVSGHTAMHAASQHGHMDVVEFLLGKGALPLSVDSDGNHPVHLAASGDFPEIIEALATAGADLNARNNARQSALHLAVSQGNTLSVKAILKLNSHCSLQDKNGDTPLHEAVTRRRDGLVQTLLDAGADVTLTNKTGFNVLHHTALRGNASAMRLILAKISNRLWLVNEKKDDGYTALHLSSLNNHTELASLLVEQGKANKDVQNINLQTPLHLAVERQHMQIIKLLMSVNAQVDIKDKEGDTVLHEAVRHHTMEQLKQLQANPDVSVVVAGVSKQASASIALLLTANGADPELKNNKGQSALDLCPDPVLKKALIRSYKPRQRQEEVEPDPLPPPSNPRTLECMICADEMRTCAFVPCGHVATCCECGSRCKKCLICKEVVVDRTKIEDECMVCSDSPATILFKPCCHVVACENCSAVVKKSCIKCRRPISDRLPVEDCVAEAEPAAAVAPSNPAGKDDEEVEKLQQQLEDIRDQTQCPVCMDRRKNLVFLCGHGTCQMCGDRMRECPICRKPIDQKIVLF